jgi:predicted transcriptional regulator
LKKKTGVPAIQFSEADIKKIEKMAGLGMTLEQIAMVWERTPRTFQKHFKNNPELKAAVDRGREIANQAVAQTAYQMALSGKSPAMTTFWLKTRARWKEVHHHEVQVSTLEDIVNASREVGEPDKDELTGEIIEQQED